MTEQHNQVLTNELVKTQVTLERFENQIERLDELLNSLVERIEKMDNTLHSTDPKDPGVATRVDRIEQEQIRNAKILNWIFGGGVLTALGTLVMLIKLAALHP